MGIDDEQLHSEDGYGIFGLNITHCRGAMNQKLEQETRLPLCLLPHFQYGLCSSLNLFLLNENSMALHQSVIWREDKC